MVRPDLDLPICDPHLIGRLRRGGWTSEDRAVLEAEGTEMPGAGHRLRVELSLVQRSAPMAAPIGQGMDPVPSPEEEHVGPRHHDPPRLSLFELPLIDDLCPVRECMVERGLVD